MQRFAGVLALFTSSAAIAGESSPMFWHLSGHGDSILLVLFGAWLVRRECVKIMYPEPPKSNVGPLRMRQRPKSPFFFNPGVWPAMFAQWQARLKLMIFGG